MRYRRLVGSCMVASAALSFATAVILPANKGEVGAQVAAVAASRGRFIAANAIALVSVILLLPSILGLAALLRPHRPRAALTGGALAAAGVMPVGVQVALGLVEWQMVAPGADRREMVALLHRIEFSAGVVPILLSAALPAIGLTVLAAGMARARLAPAWVAAFVSLGAVGLDLGFELPSLAVRIGAAALTLAGFAWLGLARRSPASARTLTA